MRAVNFFRHVPTGLSLNGPSLSITSLDDVTVNSSGSTTFTATATATFPTQTPSNPATVNGTISYRWYIDGVGAISDGTYSGATFSGTSTNTLSITNLVNPTANGLRVFLRATFTPAGYTNDQDTSTPNASNGPFIDSNIATVTVRPFITITTQPTNQSVSENREATFTIAASASDSSTSSLTYQWQLNGNNLSNSQTVLGATSTSLRISLPDQGENTIRCIVSHPSAGNSPLTSNQVTLTILPARSIINYEFVRDGSISDTDGDSIGSHDLQNGSFRMNARRYVQYPSHVIYSPERDIRVKITLAASRGGNGRNSKDPSRDPQLIGGQGGVSTFYYTFKKQQEYVFKIGLTNDPNDGGRQYQIGQILGGVGGNSYTRYIFRASDQDIGDGADGGGGTFFYERSRLIACVGGGGGGGRNGPGGWGGGIRNRGYPSRDDGSDATNAGGINRTCAGGSAISYGDSLPSGPGNDIEPGAITSPDRSRFGGVDGNGNIIPDSVGKVGGCSTGFTELRNLYQTCSDKTGVNVTNELWRDVLRRTDSCPEGSISACYNRGEINQPNQSLQEALNRIAPGSRDSTIRPRWYVGQPAPSPGNPSAVNLVANPRTTNLIVRGFKTGQGGRNNGGWSLAQRGDSNCQNTQLPNEYRCWQAAANTGGGGSGAVGGRSGAALLGGRGGGGGSGYIDPSVPLNAIFSTGVGGNGAPEGYVIIQLVSDDEWEGRFGNTYNP